MFIRDETLGPKKDKILLDTLLNGLKPDDLRMILRSEINRLYVAAVSHFWGAKIVNVEGALFLKVVEEGEAKLYYERIEELIELYNTIDEWGY